MAKCVYRPWGWYQVIARSGTIVAKVLHINPHHRLSLQRHQHRQEIWWLLRGRGAVQRGLRTTSHCFTETLPLLGHVIRKRQWHRLEGLPPHGVTILEIQVGTCREDDIERRDDDYGRR